MQLIFFVVIICTLLARQISISPSFQTIAFNWQICFIMALAVILASVVAMIHSARGFLGHEHCPSWRDRIEDACQMMHRYRIGMQWLWVAAIVVILPWTGWPQLVHRTLVETSFLTVEFLACLLPSIVCFALMDVSAFAVELQMSRYLGTTAKRNKGLINHLWNSAKHSWIFVVPFAVFSCVVFDVVRHVVPTWDETRQSLVVGFISIAGAQLFAPAFLLRIWRVTPLPYDATSQHLYLLLQHIGMQHCPIMTWSTQGRIANALMIGIWAHQRRLLLSDRLIATLSRSELELIVLHEAAHARRHHGLIRGLPLALAFFGMLLIAWLIDGSQNPLNQMAAVLALGGSALCLVGMIVLLGILARWSEFDADRYAIELAGHIRNQLLDSPESDRLRAADDLISALRAICPAKQERSKSWLHPSVACRISRIEKFVEKPRSRSVAVCLS